MKQMSIYDYPLDPITYQTRREANESVDRQKRYKQILEILSELDKPMTAKQIAVEMKRRGYAYSDERNISAPRIHELLELGKLDLDGKVKCEYSGKMVSRFKIRRTNENI